MTGQLKRPLFGKLILAICFLLHNFTSNGENSLEIEYEDDETQTKPQTPLPVIKEASVPSSEKNEIIDGPKTETTATPLKKETKKQIDKKRNMSKRPSRKNVVTYSSTEHNETAWDNVNVFDNSWPVQVSNQEQAKEKNGQRSPVNSVKKFVENPQAQAVPKLFDNFPALNSMFSGKRKRK